MFHILFSLILQSLMKIVFPRQMPFINYTFHILDLKVESVPPHKSQLKVWEGVLGCYSWSNGIEREMASGPLFCNVQGTIHR